MVDPTGVPQGSILVYVQFSVIVGKAVAKNRRCGAAICGQSLPPKKNDAGVHVVDRWMDSLSKSSLSTVANWPAFVGQKEKLVSDSFSVRKSKCFCYTKSFPKANAVCRKRKRQEKDKPPRTWNKRCSLDLFQRLQQFVVLSRSAPASSSYISRCDSELVQLV